METEKRSIALQAQVAAGLPTATALPTDSTLPVGEEGTTTATGETRQPASAASTEGGASLLNASSEADEHADGEVAGEVNKDTNEEAADEAAAKGTAAVSSVAAGSGQSSASLDSADETAGTSSAPSPSTSAEPLPEGFVYVKDVIPEILVDMRYYGSNNFMGKPASGYNANVAILSEKAAKSLRKVQRAMENDGFGLILYDAYRPASAVADFVTWAGDLEDDATKETYYPNLEKSVILEQGFIARKSAHSRGSTVDLSVVNLEGGTLLDMGCPFDFFGEEADPDWKGVTEAQAANRRLLRNAMEKEGFRISTIEWWHFSYINEPFPKTVFNFPVQ